MTTVRFPGNQKQPPPQPSKIPVDDTPSLIVYIALLILALSFLLIARITGGIDWPGLFINLASGLIEAILILIIIENRIRRDDILYFQEYTTTIRSRAAQILSKDIAKTVKFAQTYGRQLDNVRPKNYLERPGLEEALSYYPNSFLIIGSPGIGKTTLVQVIANNQAKKVIQQPWKEKIPVIMPARSIRKEGFFLIELERELNKFSRIKTDLLHKWLSEGRLLLIVDGLDESIDRENLLQKLQDVKLNYPRCTLVITTRPMTSFAPDNKMESLTSLEQVATNLGLRVIEIPPLTEEEIKELRGCPIFEQQDVDL